MKKIHQLPVISILLLFAACQMQNKQFQQSINTDSIKPVEKVYDMNTANIKKHLELQERMETSEDSSYPIYTYTVSDVEISLPIIAQGLKDKNFVALDKASFDEKIKIIFGDIFYDGNRKVKLRNKFNTILVDTITNEVAEFDYTIDNIFISKEYKFITYVPLIGDFVNFTDSSHYTIEINPPLIARNKYLFNNSQPDLAYLLHEDSLFLKTLVKSFGYTKEPKINDLAMNDYLDMEQQRMSTIGEIIFVKNATGVLEIKEELLKWISDHTQVNDNRIAQALSEYVDALYHNNNEEMYTHNPFTYFSLTEKRKITAFAANTYDPLYDKFTQKNARIWPAAGMLENLLVTDEGLADYLEQQHYFSLPVLKNKMEELK